MMVPRGRMIFATLRETIEDRRGGVEHHSCVDVAIGFTIVEEGQAGRKPDQE